MPRLFKKNRPHYEFLRQKWLVRHRTASQKLFDNHLRRMAVGSLGGIMLLSTPGLSSASVSTAHPPGSHQVTGTTSKNLLLASELVDKLPAQYRNLSVGEEAVIAQTITKQLGIPVAAEIDKKRLNKTYGIIGGEQHLYRYPGDNIFAHAKTTQDWAMFGGAGIAPNLGAWGYFAPSRERMTPLDEQRERYYAAVQTFLSPGFAENVTGYRDFYKYRKMLLINPKTGQAVVADIADAGPSPETGKDLGGSPEVMEALGLGSGPRRGEVLYFFVDEPSDRIPLGPVNIPVNR